MRKFKAVPGKGILGSTKVEAAWNGVFSPTFIMKHSNIDNKEDAKSLSDYLYENEYDSGFRSKEEFLDSFDFDDLYDEMIESE